MKWLLLLALTVSCTTRNHGEVTPTKESTPPTTTTPPVTESDAKPVSPLTVKPCFCMKMYQPVCANGVTYGNSCEAECHGNKTWKDGGCPAPKK